MKIELKKIGNSSGIIFPKELLARLGMKQGDLLSLSEGPNQTITLSPYEQDDEDTLERARLIMRKYKRTMKALAE